MRWVKDHQARRTTMQTERVHPRPRFSRGQEDPADDAFKHAGPDFARGQERIATVGERHKGSFASGQERTLHHPERGYEGRFSRGSSAAEAGELDR
jgi:hypothetical protein